MGKGESIVIFYKSVCEVTKLNVHVCDILLLLRIPILNDYER